MDSTEFILGPHRLKSTSTLDCAHDWVQCELHGGFCAKYKTWNSFDEKYRRS